MDSLSLDVNKMLDKEPAHYSLKRTQIVTRYIESGRADFSANLFNETIPRRVILALVEDSAFIGDKSKNSFNFAHFNVKEISISAGGRTYPNVPFNLDYTNDLFIRAFHESMENLGLANTIDSNNLSRERFSKGNAIYTFNLTNSLDNDDYYELIKNGTTFVNIKFNAVTPVGGIRLIALMEHDSLLLIDKNRSLATDNSV